MQYLQGGCPIYFLVVCDVVEMRSRDSSWGKLIRLIHIEIIVRCMLYSGVMMFIQTSHAYSSNFLSDCEHVSILNVSRSESKVV